MLSACLAWTLVLFGSLERQWLSSRPGRNYVRIQWRFCSADPKHPMESAWSRNRVTGFVCCKDRGQHQLETVGDSRAFAQAMRLACGLQACC